MPKPLDFDNMNTPEGRAINTLLALQIKHSILDLKLKEYFINCYTEIYLNYPKALKDPKTRPIVLAGITICCINFYSLNELTKQFKNA